MPVQRRAIIAGALGASLAAPAIRAQGAWPQRTIRLIVPFSPGGSVDGMARITAQKLQQRLGQAVVVENRSGANGALGGVAVAQADPDGHTLLFSASIQTLGRLVMRNPGYDPLADLRPVARVGQAPVLLIGNKDRPQQSVAEVIAAARLRPQDWSFGTGSLGSAGHLATVEFIRQAGLDLTVVPYRGTAPALADLIANTIALLIDPVLATLPPVLGGQVRGLAITAPQRSPAAPAVPTMAEVGLPSVDIQTWWAIWGPRALPDAVVARLNRELETALFEPDVRERVGSLGIETLFQSGAALDDFIARDFERSRELLRIARFEAA